MDTTPCHILPLPAKSFPLAYKHAQVSSSYKNTPSLHSLCIFSYFFCISFPVPPKLPEWIILHAVSILSTPTSSSVHSNVVQPLSRSPGYHSPESNGSTWLPPTSLVVPSQSPLGALVISSTFKHWYSFASFLLPFLFALVGSCILVISFLYSDSQITVPQLDSSPELNQTPVSNYLISPPVCPQSPKAQHVLIDGFIFSPKLLLVYFLSRLVAS